MIRVISRFVAVALLSAGAALVSASSASALPRNSCLDQAHWDATYSTNLNNVFRDLDYMYAWQNATYYNDAIHGEVWVADTPAGWEARSTYQTWQGTLAYWNNVYFSDSLVLEEFMDTAVLC